MWTGLSLAVLGSACSGDGGAGPSPETWVLQVAGGDAQFAAAGDKLPEPLRVSVRTLSGDVPSRPVEVRWEVVEGSGATLDHATTTVGSDEGITTNALRVGKDPGRYRVRATADGAVAAAEFEAHAVVTPVLDAVPADPVTAGDEMALSGSSFSPVATHNVVLFDGVRGQVLAASAEELTVRVPSCLPTRTVKVSVALGSLRSAERSLAVRAADLPPVLPAVGDLVDLDPGEEAACVRLARGQYLAVNLSAGTVGGGLYGFALRGLAGGAVGAPPASSVLLPGAGGGASTTQDRWDATVREMERRLEIGAPPAAPEPAVRAAVVPQVGDRRSFDVLSHGGSFETVAATVRYVGASAVLYVDVKAPANGLSDGDFEALSELFDDVIHPAVTGAFGASSDLDGNERAIILFTPVVNGLTAPDEDGFVGGFFYGLDLLPEREHSNGGEIFYALVADPTGVHGKPIDRSRVLESVPGVLAHELQHMVHFNQRILQGGATTTGSLWISEGLAHMAEDVVAQYLEERGEPAASLFMGANNVRARRFLGAPRDASLIISQGQGSLAERGAAWLFVRYLDEQFGREVLLELSRAAGTGVENATDVAGRAWDRLLGDWLTALYTDGMSGQAEALQYPVLDLRKRLSTFPGGYPLALATPGPGDFVREGVLLSSSGEHVRLDVDGEGLALALAAPTGGPPPATARFRLRIVRLR